MIHYDCSIHGPSATGWLYAITVHGISCGCAALLAVFLWYIRSWRYYQHLCLLIGPMVLWIVACYGTPPLFLPTTTITGSSMETRVGGALWMGPFLVSTVAMKTFFLCTSLYQNTAPSCSNLQTFVYWFVMMPEPQLATKEEGKLVRPTRQHIQSKVYYFLAKLLGLFVCASIMHSKEPQIFESFRHNHSWLAIHLRGTFYVWFIYLFAGFCLDFSTLSNTIVSRGRVAFQPAFLHPLWQSRSLRECWGTRWDLPVQVLLKRSAYVPVRKLGGSRAMAVLVTFVASGGLHEYTFFVHNHNGYEPGRAMLFFIVMGGVMIVEGWVWDSCLSSSMKTAIRNVPSPVISIVVTVMCSGVFERLFIRSWLKGGVVEAVGELIPHFVC